MAEAFRVLVADDLSNRGVEILRACKSISVDVKVGLSPGDLEAQIGAYDGLIIRSATKVTAKVLEAATRLKIVGRAGIGVDNVDVKAASRRGVIVENTPSGNAVTTAEHALCLLSAMVRHIPQATASMKAGKWEKKKFQGTELCDKVLGVVGLGNIGRIVADRARGLKLKVIAHDPFIGQEAARSVGAELVTLDQLYAQADFITLHTPVLPETRGMINAASIAKMKPGVMIVNAARGELVDEAALLAALESGHVAHAALDVFAKEPPDAGNPLVAHPKVTCTPHLGASTDEAQEKVALEVAEQFVAFVERGEIKNAVNLAPVRADVLPRIAPWIELASRLGALAAQLHPRGGIDALEIALAGEPGELGAAPVARAALAALLQHFCATPVNEVNAPIVAQDRGLLVTEVKRPHDVNFAAAVTLRTRGASGALTVHGTVFQVGDRREARLTGVDDFTLDAVPDGQILVVRNADKPGVIGALGTLLGERGINVAQLHVSRRAPTTATGAEVLMLWNVDGELAPVLDAVRGLAHVTAATPVSL